jgi:SAM-dependent methyltransferase
MAIWSLERPFPHDHEQRPPELRPIYYEQDPGKIGGQPAGVLKTGTDTETPKDHQLYHLTMSCSPSAAQEIKSPGWARYYARHGTSFAQQAAPRIRTLYEATYGDQAERSVLDVCCGQGTLAEHFLEHGYQVTGIDLSEPMLAFARQNLSRYLKDGRAQLIKADAADFSVNDQFGLATATFDSLNMLQSDESLSNCFACVWHALTDDGMFVFDLMTQRGFWRDYNTVWIADTPDELYVLKSVYDGSTKATARMTGFVRDGDLWERFDEFRTPTLFPAHAVVTSLHRAGWARVWTAIIDDLRNPVTDPEQFDRIFFVATRA